MRYKVREARSSVMGSIKSVGSGDSVKEKTVDIRSWLPFFVTVFLQGGNTFLIFPAHATSSLFLQDLFKVYLLIKFPTQLMQSNQKISKQYCFLVDSPSEACMHMQ